MWPPARRGGRRPGGAGRGRHRAAEGRRRPGGDAPDAGRCTSSAARGAGEHPGRQPAARPRRPAPAGRSCSTCPCRQVSGFRLLEVLRQRPALAGVPVLVLTALRFAEAPGVARGGVRRLPHRALRPGGGRAAARPPPGRRRRGAALTCGPACPTKVATSVGGVLCMSSTAAVWRRSCTSYRVVTPARLSSCRKRRRTSPEPSAVPHLVQNTSYWSWYAAPPRGRCSSA